MEPQCLLKRKFPTPERWSCEDIPALVGTDVGFEIKGTGGAPPTLCSTFGPSSEQRCCRWNRAITNGCLEFSCHYMTMLCFGAGK